MLAGNLVGIIISVIVSTVILMVFRQLDKNDRSLEKLQKYTEKLIKDINNSITSKIETLKQTSIEMEVKQKTTIAAVKRLEEIEKNIKSQEEVFTRIDDQIKKYNQIIKELLTMTENAEENMKLLRSEIEFTDGMGKKIKEAKEQLDVVMEKIPALRSELISSNKEEIEKLEKNLFEEFNGKVESLNTAYDKAIAEAQGKALKLEEQAMTKLKEQASERTHKFRDQLEEKYLQIQETAKAALAETKGEINRFKKEWEAEVQEIRTNLEGMNLAVKSSMSEIENKTTDLAQKALSSTQDELAKYKAEISYEFEQVKKTEEDIVRLNSELQNLLSDTELRIEDDFNKYIELQNQKYTKSGEDFAARENTVNIKINTIEDELNELKTKAYENVSEKLKIFEDDFFKDLSDRNNIINASLLELQEGVNKDLNRLSLETKENQKAAVTKLNENLKSEVSDLQTRLRDQLAQMEGLIENSGTELKSKIESYESGLERFTATYRQDIEALRTNATELMKKEVEEFTASNSAFLKKQEKDLVAKTEELKLSITNSQKEADSIISDAKTDFTTWKTRIEQQFTETKDFMSQKLQGLDDAATEKIEQIERNFILEKSQLENTINEKQSGLLDDTETLSARIQDMNEKLESKLQETENNAISTYNNLMEELRQSIRDNTVNVESKFKEAKQFVQDIREKAESDNDTIMKNIENKVHRLNQQLDEIDRKQKTFISQTQLFEKAEKMEKDLEENFSALKEEMKKIDDWKEYMNSMESQFAKIKKQEEEASQKITRFISEKKRVDDIEDKYTSLVNLSKSIENKISDLSNANNDIQQFQFDLRKCQEGVSEATAQFDRLDKKESILRQTIENVDKVFETFRNMEKQAQEIRDQLSTMPEEMLELKRDFKSIIENKDKITSAVEKAEALDSLIQNTEERIEKLKSDREWLAKTETRLQGISSKVDGDIKLYGDLMKNKASSKNSNGSISPETRRSVKRLAEMGWKPEAIAVSLEISVSEAELILELGD